MGFGGSEDRYAFDDEQASMFVLALGTMTKRAQCDGVLRKSIATLSLAMS